VLESGAFITAAVEGDVDEAVLRRVLVGLNLGNVYGKEGKQRLLQRLGGYNYAARHSPWVVLIDLNGDFSCAPEFMRNLLPNSSERMCLRVAVRAVEAWLIADHERLSRAFGISQRRLPGNPDCLRNPKAELVSLARHSNSRAVREEIVPREGSGRAVGPLYATRIVQFVLDEVDGWRPDEAATRSDSLRRCVQGLRRLLV